MALMIGPEWLRQKRIELIENGFKFGKTKKLSDISGSEIFSTASEYIIAEHIGKQLDPECVTIHPTTNGGDADLKFVDGEAYFLQVKTPQLFASKYAGDLERITNEFYENLNKSKSEFSYALAVNNELKQWKKPVNKKGRRASVGILAHSPVTSQRYFWRKISDSLLEANKQLEKIQDKGVKLYLLDSTHHYDHGNKFFYHLLKTLYDSHQEHLKNLNGVIMHSYQFGEGDHTNSNLFPVILSDDVKTCVFINEICLYSTMMVSFPMSMRVVKGWNEMINVEKDGIIYIDGQEYGSFWEIINTLQKMNDFAITLKGKSLSKD
jgi:hypothetical protein